MKSLIKTLILTSGIAMSTVAMSQTMSLDEYYSEYLTVEETNIAVVDTIADKTTASDKLSLTEYYAEYLK